MLSFLSGFTIPAIVLGVILVVGIIASKLYVRTSQDRAFVRTGLGGLKVVNSGGAMVLPIFQDIIWVNTNTLRLAVSRLQKDSLITKDRLRVDVSAEFYVRVAQTLESIAIAARTLGDKTMNPDELKKLVEGKFVDSLRSAASLMTMDQLHENRIGFVKGVKEAVTEDLAKNGLELESVSLTGLNQTSKDWFDESNAFDAAGLLILTQAIETKRKERNDIEQDASVQIAEKNLSATKATLEIQKQEADVRLMTDQEIAQKTAETEARIKVTQATKTQEAEVATIDANKAVELQRLDAQSVIKEKESLLVVAEQKVDQQRITSKAEVTLRQQETDIVIAEKSKDVAVANTEANEKAALEIASQEKVTTAKDVAIAERNKDITLVKAQEQAQKDSIAIVVAAEAEKTAAENKAAAIVSLATGEKEAALLQADAIQAMGNAEGAALTAKNIAANLLSPELVAMEVKKALLAALPAIIEKSVEPLKNIESIKIAEIGGLNGQNAVGSPTGVGSSSTGMSLGNEVVNAALRYQAASPMIKNLLGEVGLAGGDMDALINSATKYVDPRPDDSGSNASSVVVSPVVDTSSVEGSSLDVPATKV